MPKVAQHFVDVKEAVDMGRYVLLLTAHGPLASGTIGTVVSISRRGILSLDNRVFCDPQHRGKKWEFTDVHETKDGGDLSLKGVWVKVSGDNGNFLYNSENGEVADTEEVDVADF